ncbi:MAG: glycoside hydrolase family 5 protein [Defluviitaleaceae bacterium]|nr:glycoside hydrolase family 5 protein [Defluviitaleaceae bacterium]
MGSWEYVQKLGMGWNLGNTLDACTVEGSSPLEQETKWGNPLTTKAMITMVKNAGFDILRIPVSWYSQMDENYVINSAWLARVKKVVDYGYNSGMTVIINIHHDDWHFPDEMNYHKSSKILKKIWTQITKFFIEYDERLIFEGMNEPRKKGTPHEWNGGDVEGRRVVMKLNQDFVDTVRATEGNQMRMLMVPTYAASAYEIAMSDFSIPQGKNLIVSIHAYVPYPFALDPDMSKKWTIEQQQPINCLFELIDRYFLSKNIPVIIGECGARRKGDNDIDRAAWASYYTEVARQRGVPCIWWDSGCVDSQVEREVFGLLNRYELRWEYPSIVAAFLGKKHL